MLLFHIKDVYDILENLHISARRSKAVNTIYRQGDTVYGANEMV